MGDIRETEAADFGELKDLLSGPALRSIVGVVDEGSIAVAFIKDAAGGDPVKPHEKKRDAWVSATDALKDHPVLGRLFVPGGVLFRKPKEGETAHVMRGRAMNAPGAPLIVPDGSDGATDNFLPPWFGDGDAGLYGPEPFHVESTKDKVVITANSGGTACSITLNKDGSIDLTPADGKTVNAAGSDYSSPKWDDFLKDFNNLMATVSVIISSSTATGPLMGLAAPAPPGSGYATNADALAGALTKFALPDPTNPYKSTKAKNG